MGYGPSVRSRWLDIGQVLFSVFMNQDGVEVHKLAKKGLSHPKNSVILTEQAWPIKDLLYGFRENYFFYGTQQVVPNRQDSSGSQSQLRIRFIFPAHGASHIINEVLNNRRSIKLVTIIIHVTSTNEI